MRIESWVDKLEFHVRKYGFNEGYKFLFVPWNTINKRDTVFLTQLPYLPDTIPANQELLQRISSEDANTNQFALDIVDSPVNQQFNRLAHLIGKLPINILSGAATPFRANKWDDFSDEQKKQAVELGTSFWRKVLKQKTINLIITSGKVAKDMAINQFDTKIEYTIPSGWDNLKLTRYKTSVGTTIVCLPDLSEFELLCKDECIDPLRQVFRNFLH